MDLIKPSGSIKYLAKIAMREAERCNWRPSGLMCDEDALRCEFDLRGPGGSSCSARVTITVEKDRDGTLVPHPQVEPISAPWELLQPVQRAILGVWPGHAAIWSRLRALEAQKGAHVSRSS